MRKKWFFFFSILLTAHSSFTVNLYHILKNYSWEEIENIVPEINSGSITSFLNTHFQEEETLRTFIRDAPNLAWKEARLVVREHFLSLMKGIEEQRRPEYFEQKKLMTSRENVQTRSAAKKLREEVERLFVLDEEVEYSDLFAPTCEGSVVEIRHKRKEIVEENTKDVSKIAFLAVATRLWDAEKRRELEED